MSSEKERERDGVEKFRAIFNSARDSCNVNELEKTSLDELVPNRSGNQITYLKSRMIV